MEKDTGSDAMVNDSRESELAGLGHSDDTKETNTDHDKNVRRTPSVKRNSKKSVRRGKKDFQKVRPRRYSLRSSLDGVRVLRSMSKGQNKTSPEPLNSMAISVPKKRKKRGKGKSAPNNEFLPIKKHVRYLLTRINYEQSLIDAYSNEGWKGLSLEKIRPEKELERAKSEILRCKLRIRESCQHLDSLLFEGRFEENLFDDDGQIDSEDMFCVKCGSKDTSADNDIILCDGNCDRGFHQKCLNPPLRTDEIPPGDQGWLCPACDCKVDCLDLLNEFQGSDLSIEDTWEKVFPEAAAVANGNKELDGSNYSSDDSEDHDYDPDAPEVNTNNQEEESSSEESDSTSLSEEDLGPPRHNLGDLGLPFDDSEDDDYDPDCLDPDKDVQNEGSHSNESDFTSDSDDFCAELSKIASANEVSSSYLSDSKLLDGTGKDRDSMHKNPINAKLPPVVEGDPGQEYTCTLSNQRQRENLDYKNSSDAAYDKASSDSSEDEDWSENPTPKKVKKDDSRIRYAKSPDARAQSVNNQRSSSIKRKVKGYDSTEMENLEQPQVSETMNESTPNRAPQNLGEQHGDQLLGSNGNKAASSSRKQFDQKAFEKLQELFKENQYPNREMKESIAEELGVTVRRISKWFENARHVLKVSTMGSIPGTLGTVSVKETNHPRSTPDKGNTSVESSRKNSCSSKGNGNSTPANGIQEKRSGKANSGENQVGPGTLDAKSKEKVDIDRQKAVARELRKRRKSM